MSEKKSFATSWRVAIQSGFPILLVQTPEVDRATESIRKLSGAWNRALSGMKQAPDYLKANGYQIMTWDCVNGWHSIDSDGGRTNLVPATNTYPHKGLEWLVKTPDADARGIQPRAGFYIMQNAHMFFDEKALLPDGTPSLPELIQLFRHQYESKTQSKHLFLVGNFSDIPPELRPLTVVLDYPLPTREELEPFIREYVHETLGAKDVPEDDIKEAASAASGLTTHEVESAICVAIVASEGKGIDRQIVFEEKVNAVKRSGLLEHMPTPESLESIGGYENIKEWLKKMSKAFLYPEKARSYGKMGLPTPRGLMSCGISGTGKSLVAKATASLFGVPLFRLDIGRLMGSLVGSTEAKTRDVLGLINAIAPCVILVDEVEKSLSGAGSGAQDTGVSDRLLGSLLTYMQEKTVPVFFVFTANNAERLPMELSRKGRIDDVFFSDLPNEIERKEILRIHISKQAKSMKKFAGYERLAEDKYTGGFTGAEIEAVVGQAMFNAFNDDRDFTLQDVEKAISETTPLSKTRGEEIRALRNWAKRNQVVQASNGDLVNLNSIPMKAKTAVLWKAIEDDDEENKPVKPAGKKKA